MCKNENYIKCFKDTFFNVKRVEAGLTIKEVAEYVGVCPSSVAAFMSGEKMPKDKYIDRLCELFDVDPVRGKSEFMRAHDKWDAEFGKTVKFRVPATKQPAEPEEPVDVIKVPADAVAQVIEQVSEKVKPCVSANAILESLYGKLDFNAYRVIYEYLSVGEHANVLKALYGKVDYEAFMAVADAVRG